MSVMGDNRIVVLVDMDCFYCQVEAKLNPSFKDRPLAVVQYNAWKGGGIIAVNYEAREKGVKRGMRGDEAKKLCPDIVLAKVAEVRGKADLTKYRDAGKEVVKVFHDFSDCIERASIDEAYIDITKPVEKRMQEIMDSESGIFPSHLQTTFIIGYTENKSNDEAMRIAGLENWLQSSTEPNRLRLAVGALIVEEMRAAVYERTNFRCSAGISYNKILAKLVCGIHKPNRQTVLPPDQVTNFFASLPIQKVRNLGGKFGTEVVERLGCQTMGDLAQFSLRDLQKHYDDKNGAWLYNIARGIDNDPVTVRLIPKSIGCSKNFPGRTALATKHDVEHWMSELVSELVVRLTEDQEENKRRAQLLTVMVTQDTDDHSSGSTSRSGPLPGYNVDRIVASALSLIAKTNSASVSSDAWDPPLKLISFSASKFIEDSSQRNTSISTFFKQIDKEELHPNFDVSVATPFEKNSSMSKSSPSTSETKLEILPNYSNYHESNNSDIKFGDSVKTRSLITNHFKSQRDVCDSLDDSVRSCSNVKNCQNNVCDQAITAKEKLEGGEQISNTLLSSSKHAIPAVCPDDIESAASHSFFAKYIVELEERKHLKKCNKSSHAASTMSNLLSNTNACGLEDQQPMSKNTGQNHFENYEKCEECGEMVLLQDFPEHVDFHSALKLQKELNDSLTPPDNSIAINSNDINYCNSNTLTEKCSYCSKLIPLHEFPEHIDYHSALELQKELNKTEIVQSHSSASTSHGSNVTVNGRKKRGKSLKQGPSPSKKLRTNNIAAFFVPK